MNNFDLWKIINFIVGKDVYANVVSAPEMELELQAKNLRLFRQKLGFPETYAPGQAPPIALDTTRLLQTDLRPFYMEEEIPVTSGIATMSSWFYIEDYYTEASKNSEIISRQEVSNRLKDPQLIPTSEDLAAYIVKEGLKVYPLTTTTITALYIRQPLPPLFKVKTEVVTLDTVYDEANSIELEWDDPSKLDILHLILADYGIHIERAEVTNYAEQLIKTGN